MNAARCLALALAALLVTACSPRGMTLAAVGYHLPEHLPPQDEDVATYTLFLSCSAEQSTQYAQLKDGFEAMGVGADGRHAVIWVEEENVPGPSVSKGQELVRRFRVAYGAPLENASGPFAIVSGLHPMQWPHSPAARSASGLPVAISFKDRSKQGVRAVLKCLTNCVATLSANPTGAVPCGQCGLVVIPGTVEGDDPG
jgi:hypothetical protein